MLQHGLDRAARVGRLGDDVKAAFLECEADSESGGSMVVGQDDAQPLGYGSPTSTTVPVPGLEKMFSPPPSISARSPMLTSPRPRPAR